MAEERSLVLLKPGILERRILGEVLGRFERKGLRIIAMKLMRVSGARAEAHYAEHKDKPFYAELIDYITSGPVVALVVGGEGAVGALRRLCGPTRPSEAPPGTIRGDFALHTNVNIVHASDSPSAADREIRLFFEPSEIIEWKDGNDEWI
ncbi:MAG TPA: nucleoside-diphosphate kinase [Rectinemataceae bacterium]